MTGHIQENAAHMRENAELTQLGPMLDKPGQFAVAAPAEVAAVIVDSGAPLGVRLAAGVVLALLGDPRTPTEPELVTIPGGAVEIGLDETDVAAVVRRWEHVGVLPKWIEKETPQFTANLADFRLGRYPITNSQYRDFLLATGYGFRPSTWYLGAYPWERANHPVAGVSTEDVDAYLVWLSDTTGTAYRLPTETEWEHAAKGFTGKEYPWGDEFEESAANTRETGVHTTTPVGAFPIGDSPFGLADMAGNVEEYVSDEYFPYPGGRRIEDHLSEALGHYRITRGGSFARYGDLCRCRRRHGSFPNPLYSAGFRIAADVEVV